MYKLHIIQIYASTSNADDNTIEQLYEDIILTQKAIKSRKYTLLRGDLILQHQVGNGKYKIRIRNLGFPIMNARREKPINYIRNENLNCMNIIKKTKNEPNWKTQYKPL